MKHVSSCRIAFLLIVTLLLAVSNASAFLLSPAGGGGAEFYPRSAGGGGGGAAAVAAAPTLRPTSSFYRATNHPFGHAAYSTITKTQLKCYFSGNSKDMLDTVCAHVPWPFRNVARTALLKELKGLMEQNHHPIITETHVYEAVLKHTPGQFHSQAIQLLDDYRTVTTITSTE
jgi:hypothetical protein